MTIARLLRLLGHGTMAIVLSSTVTRSASGNAQEDADKADKERERAEKSEEKSREKELEQARKAAEVREEIQSELDLLALRLIADRYDDSFLQDYINEMGQRLVPQETPEGVLFSFRVVDDATPNAMALADGRIYLNSGLLVFVENEAQLACVIGHEIAHVLAQHTVESIREGRSFKKRFLPGILGAAVGGVVGGIAGGKGDAAKGAAIGAAVGTLASVAAMNSYNRKQENEADMIGGRLAMAGGYDPAEGVKFYEKLARTFRERDRFSNMLWGSHPRNVERIAHFRELLGGELADTYNQQRSAGQLSIGSGEMRLYTSRMLRDAAISYMNDYDRYDIAKTLLESIADYRTRDPKTQWALGRVYKMVGRTDADRARGLDSLTKAAALDERNLYPWIHRDLGLMRARTGADGMTAAVESLKKYIRGWMDRYNEYPPDIIEMYDYLIMFGDSKWTAPRMETELVRTTVREPGSPGRPAEASSPGAAHPRALRPTSGK